MTRKVNPQRGEIWIVNFDPTIGSEIQKSRPAVVLSINALSKAPHRIVAPITGYNPKHERFPWCVPLQHNARNGLDKDSIVDAAQVKCVSIQRFQRHIGSLPNATVDEITQALSLCVGF